MKNMKKIFTGVAIVVALSTSSSVFADKFSAFDGVPTEAVSRIQLDEVSGEGVLGTVLGWFGIQYTSTPDALKKKLPTTCVPKTGKMSFQPVCK
jgi:hypothetical protein